MPAINLQYITIIVCNFPYVYFRFILKLARYYSFEWSLNNSAQIYNKHLLDHLIIR